MFKLIKFGILIAAVLGLCTLLTDRQNLREELVRLHVVGASDGEHDQSVKLLVRDAVVQSLNAAMEGITDAQQAKEYIRTHLPEIEAVANRALQALGESKQAVVTFLQEEFPTRVYDTFSLPSGIYDSLRITIGEGEGRNWWCVVFPSLCMKATSAEVSTAAAGAGFSTGLSNAVTGQEGYQIRFYLLDVLGKIENLFHRG